MTIRKIMVPVDGSDHSVKAAEYAVGLAGLTDAEILLVHCHKSFPALLGEPYFQHAVNKIMEKANWLLDPYREIFRSHGVRFTERILEGSAGEMICEVAAIEKCDLIVMGSRGLTDLKGLFLGSVAHRVLSSASCPVLVMR